MQTPAKSPRKAAAIFIFVTVMLDMLSFGLIGPVLPQLIKSFVGGDAAYAGWIIGLFGTAWACVQFVSTPIFGIVSDRIGRRPLILLSNLGTSLDYVIMALAPGLGWLFVGRLISGATTASMTTAYAYIADATKPHERAKDYGLIGAAFGLGFILGPAIGGYLGTFGARVPFWAAAAFSMANFLYGLLVLPESLAPANRTSFIDWKKANPIGAFAFLQKRPQILGLASVNFLGYLAHESLPIVWVIYCIARFGWNSLQVGLTLTLVGATSVLSQLFLVGPVVKRFGERRTMVLGLAFAALGYICFSFANGWIVVVGIAVSALGFYMPASQALLTHRVAPNEQGALQGALGAVRSLTMMLGPVIFAWVFARTIGSDHPEWLRGAPWMLAGILVMAAVPLAIAVTNRLDDINLPETPIDIEALNPET
jgi:DHA1 family tetracycline resistance protein-like MFS transporter